ncbi:MAG: AIR synthase-related protein, partial [Dehalococcoidia bacterium]
SYLPAVLPLLGRDLIHGMAHITGGGLIANVPRMLPDGLAAEFDPGAWSAPPIFAYLVDMGQVEPSERFRAFNMGLGFVLAVDAGQATTVLSELNRIADTDAGCPGGAIVGRVVPRGGGEAPAVRGLTAPGAS